MPASLLWWLAALGSTLLLLASSLAALRADAIRPEKLEELTRPDRYGVVTMLLRDYSILSLAGGIVFIIAGTWFATSALLARAGLDSDEFLGGYAALVLGASFLQGWRGYRRRALALDAHARRRGSSQK